MLTQPTWNRGSEWHRWDPHIHTPGTMQNDQFNGDWNAYLERIETSAPAVEALGLTDYCVIETYKTFLEHKRSGRAANVRFAFPNVEFRLTVETRSGRGINLHLLFSPDDADHVARIERALSHLTYEYNRTPYRCIPGDLRDLGRAADTSIRDDQAALRKGVEQFKLNLDNLRSLLRTDAWTAENCLIAVVTSTGDGVGGLQGDGAFETLREELKALADVVFTGHPTDREFWLGRKVGFPRDFIERTYGGLKPCLHGSDAHDLEHVLKPDKDRLCWIRADLTFSGLKQTLLEPEDRVCIGPQPPPGPSPSECLDELVVRDAEWLAADAIRLNTGLVAVIGPKGSGKTALADMVAHAAGAAIEDDSSFLIKAREHLGTSSAHLAWCDGTTSEQVSLIAAGPQAGTAPAVRYLSQKFVDRLCSTSDLGEELLREIEAVVFEAIPTEDRLETYDFDQLRALRKEQIDRLRTARVAEIERFSEIIAREDDNKSKLPEREKALETLKAKLEKEEKELKGLLPKEKKAESDRLAAVQDALDKRTVQVQSVKLRIVKLGELRREYGQMRSSWSHDFDDLRARFRVCGLVDSDWKALEPAFSPDPEQSRMFEGFSSALQDELRRLEGTATLLGPQADVSAAPLKSLQATVDALTKAIGVERTRARKHSEVLRRVGHQKQEKEKLEKELVELRKADDRRKGAIEGRRAAYAAVFETFVEEQKILEDLYEPLRQQLAGEGANEKRLEFYVRRHVDVSAWVARGEGLLDLRKAGTFRGHGTLEQQASELMPAWREGGAAEVAAAMQCFIDASIKDLVQARLPEVSYQDLGRWLFSTDHVSLEYGIKYDGVDLSRLSPGMRGTVLLMLYLAVDQWDTRPLVVDQPEENLDPHSVYEELVRYFRAAKRRRQVILVTHNPNLVVNADADQVIVAASDREGRRGLPRISYISGGLEDKTIRSNVCRILEGGERAFLDRDRRYAIPRDLRRAPRSTG